jgi:hypothetical protein
MKIIYCLNLFITLLVVSNNLICQQTTFKYISGAEHNMFSYDLIELQDGTILFCGSFSPIEEPQKKVSYIIKLDAYGRFMDSLNNSYVENSSFFASIISYDTGGLLMVEGVYNHLNSNKDAKFVLSNMDEELNILSRKTYTLQPDLSLLLLNASTDFQGKIMLGGTVVDEHNVLRPLIYVLNNKLDSIIGKIMVEQGGMVWQTKSLSNNQYWFARIPGARYYLTDSVLNVIDTQQVPDFISSNLGVKWDTDTSFYLMGSKSYPDPGYNLAFIRQFDPIDTSGYIFNQWGISDTVDLPAATNGIDFNNKDTIYIGGSRDIYTGVYNKWPSWFIILQTDSMLNVRWEKFYGGDAHYVMSKIVASRDGGCLVSGTRYDYQNIPGEQTNIVILKLNAQGILVGMEDGSKIKTHESIVYPNPGTSEIKVRIAAQHTESLFQLYDMNGKLVVSNEIYGKWRTINTAFLNPGTYIYRITSKQGLFESGKWVRQ